MQTGMKNTIPFSTLHILLYQMIILSSQTSTQIAFGHVSRFNTSHRVTKSLTLTPPPTTTKDIDLFSLLNDFVGAEFHLHQIDFGSSHIRDRVGSVPLFVSAMRHFMLEKFAAPNGKWSFSILFDVLIM